MMENNNVYDGFQFYGNWYEIYKALPEGINDAYLKAIIEYGCEGKMVSKDDPILWSLMNDVVAKIDIQKINWEKRGGRPKVYNDVDFNALFDEGLSSKEIEEKVGCSASTVKRKKKEWQGSKPNEPFEPQEVPEVHNGSELNEPMDKAFGVYVSPHKEKNTRPRSFKVPSFEEIEAMEEMA